MRTELKVPRISEDEAYNRIVAALKRIAKVGGIIDLFEVMQGVATAPSYGQGSGSYIFDLSQNTEVAQPFYSAAWRLCLRGIIYSVPTHVNFQYSQGVMAGFKFGITEYGAAWLQGLSDYDCPPTDYGRFSQLLANHSKRLGAGYHTRSQEAVSCYRGQTYLGCCALCGAATESIMLALAIAKKGSEEEVLQTYNTARGRNQIERIITDQQNSYIQQQLPNFTGLLNYWRDAASHGADTTLGEEEAFTALILLLRFAKFADDRWSEITGG